MKVFIVSFLYILSYISCVYGNKQLSTPIPSISPTSSPHVSSIPTYTIIATPSMLPGMKDLSSPNQTLVITGAAAVACIGLVLASACYFRHFKIGYITKTNIQYFSNSRKVLSATDTSLNSTDSDHNNNYDVSNDYKKTLLSHEYIIISDYAKISEYELQPTSYQPPSSSLSPSSSAASLLLTSSTLIASSPDDPSSSPLRNTSPPYLRTYSQSSTNSVQEEVNGIISQSMQTTTSRTENDVINNTHNPQILPYNYYDRPVSMIPTHTDPLTNPSPPYHTYDRTNIQPASSPIISSILARNNQENNNNSPIHFISM